jgi:NADH-quinone oxidoreductase subunit C
MIEFLKAHYDVIDKGGNLYKIERSPETLISTMDFLSSNSTFITLSQIACTDWIEEGVFALNYILTNSERNQNLMIEIRIGREESQMPTLINLFPQAEVMERDLHEMYGIDFIGHPTLYDFALENWEEIPPMRREFDTLAYVNEQFDFRGGREDNKDVKVEMKRRRAEAKARKAEEAAQQETNKNEEASDGNQ